MATQKELNYWKQSCKWAVNIAIEGREAWKYRWQSDLGEKYGYDISITRIKEINKELELLRELKNV